jgi:hypothetical protein
MDEENCKAPVRLSEHGCVYVCGRCGCKAMDGNGFGDNFGWAGACVRTRENSVAQGEMGERLGQDSVDARTCADGMGTKE